MSFVKERGGRKSTSALEMGKPSDADRHPRMKVRGDRRSTISTLLVFPISTDISGSRIPSFLYLHISRGAGCRIEIQVSADLLAEREAIPGALAESHTYPSGSTVITLWKQPRNEPRLSLIDSEDWLELD